MARTPLDEGDIEQIIQTLREAGLVPVLADARVYLAGVGVGIDTMSPARLGRLCTFWTEYFKATEAELVKCSKSLGSFP